MKSAIVVYKDDDYDVEITIRQATVLDGMKRAILEMEASMEPLDLVEEKYAGYLRFMTSEAYPCCMASVEKFENGEDATKKLSKDMSFEDFANLPDALFQRWQKVAYELNAHWVYKSSGSKEGEESEPTDSES